MKARPYRISVNEMSFTALSQSYYEGETVCLRTLPIGGNNFTETLAKSFKLSFAKAEELKRNAASSKYAKQIFQAMRPVFADLIHDVAEI